MSDIDWLYVGAVGMWEDARIGNVVKAYIPPQTIYGDTRGMELFSSKGVTFGVSVIPAKVYVLKGHTLYEAEPVEECKNAFGKPFYMDGQVLHLVKLTGIKSTVKYSWE